MCVRTKRGYDSRLGVPCLAFTGGGFTLGLLVDPASLVTGVGNEDGIALGHDLEVRSTLGRYRLGIGLLALGLVLLALEHLEE